MRINLTDHKREKDCAISLVAYKCLHQLLDNEEYLFPDQRKLLAIDDKLQETGKVFQGENLLYIKAYHLASICVHTSTQNKLHDSSIVQLSEIKPPILVCAINDLNLDLKERKEKYRDLIVMVTDPIEKKKEIYKTLVSMEDEDFQDYFGNLTPKEKQIYTSKRGVFRAALEEIALGHMPLLRYRLGAYLKNDSLEMESDKYSLMRGVGTEIKMSFN